MNDQLNTSAQTWEHVYKLTIDSCKEQGSTLSSDLLCLSTFSFTCNSHNADPVRILFAGGVDGRIHVWSIKKEQVQHHHGHRDDNNVNVTHTKKENNSKASKSKLVIHPMIDAIAVHDGRVNKMIFCENFNNTLFSIGNDGAIPLAGRNAHYWGTT